MTSAKIQTRHQCFETNSSSSHSLTLNSYDIPMPPVDQDVLRSGFIAVPLGDYGWGYDALYSFEEKLSYLMTEITGGEAEESSSTDLEPYLAAGMSYTNARALAIADDHVKGHALEPVVRALEDYLGIRIGVNPSSGYVDHQSVGTMYHSLKGDSNDEIIAFFLNTQNFVEIDNDNH